MGASGSHTNSPWNSRPGTPDLATSGAAHRKSYSAGVEKEKVEVEKTGHERTKVQRKKKSKAVTSLLRDQLVDLKDAIEQVALKDSKFNRQGEIGEEYFYAFRCENLTRRKSFSGSLYSARRLAQNLFSNLSSVWPPRQHLLVEGVLKRVGNRQSDETLIALQISSHISALRLMHALRSVYSTKTVGCIITAAVMVRSDLQSSPQITEIFPRRKCARRSSVSTRNASLCPPL